MTTVRLRPEGPDDAAAVRRVVAAAFAAPDRPVPAEVRLVEALRDSAAWLPELAMLAEADGEVVGYALLTRVLVQPGAVPALALGPVAVLPKRQGLGYGTDVVQAALDAATELGERLIVVLGDPAYYRRFGFAPATRYALTSPWSGLGAPWQALVLPPSVSDAAFGDATVTGDGAVPSGEVNYPLPWSQV